MYLLILGKGPKDILEFLKLLRILSKQIFNVSILIGIKSIVSIYSIDN